MKPGKTQGSVSGAMEAEDHSSWPGKAVQRYNTNEAQLLQQTNV